MSDTAVTTTKGFNLIVAKSVEVIQKYADLLKLGVCKPFIEILQAAETAAIDETEMAKAQARADAVDQMPMNGKGEIYVIVPSEGLWADCEDAMDRFVCALAEIGCPTKTRFLAENAMVLDEGRGDVVRNGDLPWLNLLKEHGIPGNYEGSPKEIKVSEEEQMLMLGRIHESFAIGNIRKGEVFIVNEVGFLALSDFNFYAAHQAFDNHADYINGQKQIDDFLLNMVCAKTFAAEEGAPVDDDFQGAIDLWNSYSPEKQHTLAFNIDQPLPTTQQLTDVARMVPCPNLNVFQVLMFAMELDNTYDGDTIRGHIEKATDAQKANPEYWTNIQLWIQEAHHKAHEAQLKEEYGFLIRPIQATEEGGVNKVHTEGAAELVGFEAFLGSAHMACNGLATFLENLVLMVRDGAIEDVYAVTQNHGRLPDGTALRSKAIEADPLLAFQAGMLTVQLPEGTRLLQVLIPDPTNKLPDEEGYDHVNYPQPVYALVKPTSETLN